MRTEIYNGSCGTEIGDMELYIQVSISPVKLAVSPHPFHSHSAPELILVEGGVAEVEFSSGKRFTVSPGKVCYIPAGAMHRTNVAEGSPTKMRVGYAYGRIKRPLSESAHLYGSFENQVKDLTSPNIMEDSAGIGAVLSWMLMNGNDRSYLSSVILKAKYQILGVGIIRLFGVQEDSHGGVPDTSEQTKFTRMKEIESFLEFWYSHPVSEYWLADVMKLSPRQINRLFHECFNMSFRDKLTEVRLNHAVDFLLGTDLKVEEIAYKVGYTTAAGFQNAFRKKYGLPPGRFRKENFKKD